MNNNPSIYLIFHKAYDVTSTTICYLTRSVYSHVSLIITNGDINDISEFSNLYAYSARPLEGTYMKLFNYEINGLQDSDYDVYKITKDINIELLMESLNKKLYKKYDYAAIFGYIFRMFLNDKDKWFCSEMVYESIKDAGLDLLNYKAIEKNETIITPKELSLSPYLEIVQYNNID